MEIGQPESGAVIEGVALPHSRGVDQMRVEGHLQFFLLRLNRRLYGTDLKQTVISNCH
jgi:hypothetical protein